jgi:CRISPR type III-A-associated RAMP protein Csm4
MFEYTAIGDQIIHYFPKPLTNPYAPESFAKKTLSVDELHALTLLKSMQTVRGDDFSGILQARKHDHHFYEECLAHLQKTPVPFHSVSHFVSMPHRSMNRLARTHEIDDIYYTDERAFFKHTPEQQSGVFFCMKCDNELIHDLRSVIYFLADKGIGGGVSTGKGHFTSVDIIDDLPYQEPPGAESSHVTTLSLVYPDNELKKLLSRSWYTLERRQGKIESMYVSVAGHIRKDSLLMLCEGSTFPKTQQRQYGMNTVVCKAGNGLDFNIWHYGYAFTVNTQHIIAS